MLSSIEPPLAKLVDHEIHFGHVEGQFRGDNIMKGQECIKKKDPFFWLRDDDRENEEIIRHLKLENVYTGLQFYASSENKQLYNKLEEELRGMINENYRSVRILAGNPNKNRTYYTYIKNVEGKSHDIHYVDVVDKENSANNKTYILLDENALKKDEGVCNVEDVEISHNHRYMSYCHDNTGDEIYTYHLFDISNLDDPKEIEHNIPALSEAEVVMTDDEKFIFYLGEDSANRHDKLFIYNIESKETSCIFTESDPTKELDISMTSDGEFLLINSKSYKMDDYKYLDLTKIDWVDSSTITPKRIYEPNDKERCTFDKVGDYLIILTNKLGNVEMAPMYCKISDGMSDKNWKFINRTMLDKKIDKSMTDYLFWEDVYTTKNNIIFQIRHNGVVRIVSIKIRHSTDKDNTDEPFDTRWTVMSPYDDTGVLDIYHVYHESNKLVVEFSSLVNPSEYTEYDINSRRNRYIKKDTIPNYNKEDYISGRVYALSTDGKKIPISLVYRKELNRYNGPHRLHLDAYGAYGYSCDTEFNRDIIPLLNRGYIYAIAHVRGGGFMGNGWYKDGRMMNKMNTFTDFEAVAQYLIENGYTKKELLSCEGRSAGGLVAGYAITKMHNVFNAVVAEVPFVDVLATMSDPTIPLTTQEWEQWGNPNNMSHYDYINKYSPYDNIEFDVDYPNYYVTGGLHDNRVAYWEPAKFVAKLRYSQKEGTKRLQLLDTKLDDGHLSASDRYRHVKDIAKKYLFLLMSISKTYLKIQPPTDIADMTRSSSTTNINDAK